MTANLRKGFYNLGVTKMVLRTLGELPNTAGFKFIGVRYDGKAVNCFVFYDPERCIHRIGGQACYDDLMGWRER